MMEERTNDIDIINKCPTQYVLAINDALNVINGKWKMPIIGTLRFGKMRFVEIQKNIPKISPRMLSKELKELELNGVISRNVVTTSHVMVEYRLTESGTKLIKVADAMIEWGILHRRMMKL